MLEEKLLDFCNENYDFDKQMWICDNIPEEILDCVIKVMRDGGPNFGDANDDFIIDFVTNKIINSKYGTIIKRRLKKAYEEDVEETIKSLFD